MHERTYITLEEATALLMFRTSPVEDHDTVSLTEAAGRVLWRDIFAGIDLPSFDRSPLDGYALRSADLAGAGPDSPAVLTVTDLVLAGDWPKKPLEPGQAVRIMTGAPIPNGADCVVRQEDTDYGEEKVRVHVSLRSHENFCFLGEDVKAGTRLFSQGERLDWTHVAALAGQGLAMIEVFRRPRVAVLPIGDELFPLGSPLAPGKIYDSNGPMLCSRLCALHMEPIPGPIGVDAPEVIASLIRSYLADCDMVVTSGGVSVGQKDCIPRAAELLDAEILFHGVAAKPGSPVLAMLVEGKPVVCLSGNPFAAAAIFEVLVRPVLERMSGCSKSFPLRRTATLRGNFPKASGTRRLIRARLDGDEVWVRDGNHSSGMVLGLAGCNCLVDIPAGTPALQDGDKVEAILF